MDRRPPTPKSAKVNSFNYALLVAVIVFLLERQGLEMWPFFVFVAFLFPLSWWLLSCLALHLSVVQEAKRRSHLTRGWKVLREERA